MTDAPLTAARLWRGMTPAQRLAAAGAFWNADEAADDQMQAMLLIARQKKFRPKTIAALDVDRKSRHLASLASLPEGLAARALIAYHLATQRPMMGAFLDALGIAHEDGLIQEDSAKPDSEKLPSAAEGLRERFPPDDVLLYLKTLICQDPETWGGLSQVIRELDGTNQG